MPHRWMPYAKLHGAGNSYVYVDARQGARSVLWPRVARRVADAATGLGGDGLIVLLPSRVAEVAMRIFNRDGSEAELCGNGIRGVGKFLYDRGECGRVLTVETPVGLVPVSVVDADARGAHRLRAVLGQARAVAPEAEPLVVDGRTFFGVTVDMGNPHLILFVPRLPDSAWMARWGPPLERHPRFPAGINVHAVRIDGRGAIRVRHWERGSGLTRACGSGACAAVAAGQRAGWLDPRVEVRVPGGRLVVEQDASGGLALTGPAEEIARGLVAV